MVNTAFPAPLRKPGIARRLVALMRRFSAIVDLAREAPKFHAAWVSDHSRRRVTHTAVTRNRQPSRPLSERSNRAPFQPVRAYSVMRLSPLRG